jgi:hypothetical protein
VTAAAIEEIAQMLRMAVDKHGAVDVGQGAEDILRVSMVKLQAAIHVLQDEGYEVWNIIVPKESRKDEVKTVIKVLAVEGTTYGLLRSYPDLVKPLTRENVR